MSNYPCKQCKSCGHWLPNESCCSQPEGVVTITDGVCDHYVLDPDYASTLNPYNPLLHPVHWAEWEALEKGRTHGDE